MPCPQQYICDETTNQCVPLTGRTDAPTTNLLPDSAGPDAPVGQAVLTVDKSRWDF